MAAESLLSYLVHIESFASADSRPTSIRHSLGSAIDATIEMAQILERLIYGFQRRQAIPSPRGRPKLQIAQLGSACRTATIAFLYSGYSQVVWVFPKDNL